MKVASAGTNRRLLSGRHQQAGDLKDGEDISRAGRVPQQGPHGGKEW